MMHVSVGLNLQVRYATYGAMEALDCEGMFWEEISDMSMKFLKYSDSLRGSTC
jgi:hypothetical protein